MRLKILRYYSNDLLDQTLRITRVRMVETTLNSPCEVPRESGWDEILDWTASMVRVWALSILRSGQ